MQEPGKITFDERPVGWLANTHTYERVCNVCLCVVACCIVLGALGELGALGHRIVLGAWRILLWVLSQPSPRCG